MITFVPKNHNIPRPQGAIPLAHLVLCDQVAEQKTIHQ